MTKNSYNSIISLLQVMFENDDVINYFKSHYPSLTTEDVKFDGFKVEFCPDKTEYEELLFNNAKDYEFVRISIDKYSAIKASKENLNDVQKENEVINNPKTGLNNYIFIGLGLVVVSIIILVILKYKKR